MTVVLCPPESESLNDSCDIFLFQALPVFFIKHYRGLCVQRQMLGNSIEYHQLPSVKKALNVVFF